MKFIELMVGAVVGTFLGAALYHEVQRLMPIVSNKIKASALYVYKRLAVFWREREPKNESKHLK